MTEEELSLFPNLGINPDFVVIFPPLQSFYFVLPFLFDMDYYRPPPPLGLSH